MGRPGGHGRGNGGRGPSPDRRPLPVRQADRPYRASGPGRWVPPFLKKRAVVYVDGFNLFHALLEQGRPEWLWLDLRTLARGLIDPSETLVDVVWASAHRPQGRERMDAHFTYEAALRARKVRCLMGHFVVHTEFCQSCGHGWRTATEKQSDVNLALAIASDLTAQRFDTAYIVSTDGDHAATARFVKETRPRCRVVSVAPPGRVPNRVVSDWSDALVGIGPNLVAASLLPERIKTRHGWISRPDGWTPPAPPTEPPPPPVRFPVPDPAPFPPPGAGPGPQPPGGNGHSHLRLVVSNDG